MSTSFLAALSCFFLWTTLYYMICAFNNKRSLEWNCRIITVCHGILSCTICLYCGIIVGPWPFDALGDPNTHLQTLCIAITLGYFLFDFIWCILMKTEGIDMLLHHITSICGLALSLYLESSGAELIATIFGSEISNPSLQLRWFLRAVGKYETTFAKANDIVFIMLFLCIRIGLGALLFFYTLSSPKPDILIKVGGVALYNISLVWMLLILRFAKRRFFGKRRKHSNQQ